eukprot:754059-Hanusia_phi.AAC.4
MAQLARPVIWLEDIKRRRASIAMLGLFSTSSGSLFGVKPAKDYTSAWSCLFYTWRALLLLQPFPVYATRQLTDALESYRSGTPASRLTRAQ